MKVHDVVLVAPFRPQQLQRIVGNGRRVGIVDPDDPSDFVPVQHGGVPDHRGAPVVPHVNGLLDAERVEKPGHVGRELGDGVVFHRRRAIAGAVAALIDGDGPIARVGQPRHHPMP